MNDMRLLLVINCILCTVSYPILAIAISYYTHLSPDSHQYYTFNIEVYFMTTLVALGGAFMLSYITAINSFNYLHNKNISDMHLSLPISHKTRFWVNYCTGLLISILPYVIMSLVAIIVLYASANTEILELEFEYMGGLSGFMTKYAIPCILTGLLSLIMMYSLTILCTTLCGKLAIVTMYPILISAAIPMLIQVLSAISLENARGVFNGIEAYLMTITTPVVFLINTMYSLVDMGSAPITKPIYIIPLIIITTGMITASFYLSKNVKAENIGRDFLYKLAYHIQQSIICLCITSFFFYAAMFARAMYGYIIWSIILTAVVFLVGNIIYKRGFKGLKKAFIAYAITVTASLLLCTGLNLSNGFGAEKYVPSADSITGISIMGYRYNDDNGGYYELSKNEITQAYPYYTFVRKEEYTDAQEWKETVEFARNVHIAFIDSPGNQNFWVNIEYELKNGLKVGRYYNECDVDKLLEMGVLVYVEYDQQYEHEYDDDIYWW